MDRNEKSLELLEQAEKLGVRLEFVSGIVVVKITAGDSERQDAIIADLGKYLREVRPLIERRAIAARGKAFVGQRIYSPEHGGGVLSDALNDGSLLGVFERKDFPSPMQMRAAAEGLLIIVDEGWDSASSPQNDKPAVAPPRKGILERLRGS